MSSATRQSISVRQARRLALVRAGLLKPEWLALPSRGAGGGKRARDAAHRVVQHFGYLQLDTVCIAGARSHTIVLLSRIAGMQPALGEDLLCGDGALFEYWGHEASWLPMELYPAFEFRRREFDKHPWWGDVVREHPKVARELTARIRDEGAIRSLDMDGRGSRGWWDLKTTKRVADALWSSGRLAIARRQNFQRQYDLIERVIPEALIEAPLPAADSYRMLLRLALQGHGWATRGTLAATWRLRNCREAIDSALDALIESGEVVACSMQPGRGERVQQGFILRDDLELAERLDSVRPRRDQGLLLSPFDPLLWDRNRVQQLFGFEALLEIFKPAPQRRFGYYCLPVLAGEQLIGRMDFKADHSAGALGVLSNRFENSGTSVSDCARADAAARHALSRYADALDLSPQGWP